jgi:dTDP-4-dehydrorhamnose 3,5-epimerase
MRFEATPLAGAYVIQRHPHADERGFFARTFCREAFAAHGLVADVAQSSTSYNRARGTLRGLHFQAAPHEEVRLVRCTRGAIFDVIVDLRPDSPTHHRWFAVELSAANGTQLYVPRGFAHGFQTLEDDTEVHYQMSVSYSAAHSRGYHWASPAFAVQWPLLPPAAISARDQALESVAR